MFNNDSFDNVRFCFLRHRCQFASAFGSFGHRRKSSHTRDAVICQLIDFNAQSAARRADATTPRLHRAHLRFSSTASFEPCAYSCKARLESEACVTWRTVVASDHLESKLSRPPTYLDSLRSRRRAPSLRPADNSCVRRGCYPRDRYRLLPTHCLSRS